MNESSHLIPNLLLFGQLLRRGGLDVHTGRVQDAIVALEAVGIEARADVRAALASLLVHRRGDLSFFNRAFDLFWRARQTTREGLPLASLGERPRVVAAPSADARVEFESDEGSPGATPRVAAGAWSASEALRTKDFGDMTAGELTRAEALLADIGWRLGVRRTRRWVAASAGAVDLRQVVRRNLTRGGELAIVPRRTRGEKPRPVVILADVSGSMERYTRMLLQFAFGLSGGRHDVESFVFATRLTRITRELSQRGPGALSVVARRVQDWGGGTRIGDALRAFNVHYARRVIRHGPVVLVFSDGWDRGDPAVLARELSRVRRSCRRLVWLNPLLGSRSYEPLTRGMRAALPIIDDFLPAHNVASLEQLAARLASLGSRSLLVMQNSKWKMQMVRTRDRGA